MGGHPWAQAPEHVDCEDVSASNRYRLFPSGPTKNVPRLVLAVPTVTPSTPEGLLDAVGLAEVAGAGLFEQAAASRPIATTTTVALPILELTMSSSTLSISPAIGYYGRGWPRDCRV
jgi:hypothetical protein